METLSNSSSRVLSDNLRSAAAAASRSHHPREIRFLASWSPSRRGGLSSGFSRWISLHHNTRVHAISGSSQELLKSEEAQTGDATRTVQVNFLLQKECAFGEQFHLVGDDPILGLWDPLSAIPLDWSEGNMWTLELDLPVGKSFQFKFILKGSAEDILWQPGPDRILHTWETKETIWVSEDWENAELQVISDKEPTASEKLIIIPEPVKEVEEALNEDKASYAKRSIDELEETVSVLNKNADTGDKTLAVNGGAVTSKAFAGTKEGVTLVTYEGEPVLVPGLTVVDASEETFSSETDKATVGNGLSGVEMAKEQNVAELELEMEPDTSSSSSHSKASTTVMMLSDDEELLPESKEQVDKKFQLATTVQGQPNSKLFQNNVLEKDMQWGRKTLQKLVANFGSLLHQMD